MSSLSEKTNPYDGDLAIHEEKIDSMEATTVGNSYKYAVNTVVIGKVGSGKSFTLKEFEELFLLASK